MSGTGNPLPPFAQMKFTDAEGFLTPTALQWLAQFVPSTNGNLAGLQTQVNTVQTTANDALTTANNAEAAAGAAQTTANNAQTAAGAAQVSANLALTDVALRATIASPQFTGASPEFSTLFPGFAADATAAAGGIVLGQLYWSTTVLAVVQRRV